MVAMESERYIDKVLDVRDRLADPFIYRKVVGSAALPGGSGG